MAKFAIITLPFFGHINTTISVGQRLLAKGHAVTWITIAPLKGLNIPAGGELFFTNEEHPEVSQLLKNVKQGKKRQGLEGIKYITEDVLIPLSEMMYPKLLGALRHEKPDIIIYDEQTYAGAIAAHELKIPAVTSYSVPSGILENTELDQLRKWHQSSLVKLQEDLGFRDQCIDFHSTVLGLVFCPKNFRDLFDQMPFQKFVGPCIDVPRPGISVFDFSQLQPSRQYILVSIGTLMEGEAENFFKLVVEDFTNSPYGIILTADPNLFDHWPENFIVQENIPQVEVLKHVDAVITHGGANTVCETIGVGKPLVVIPMAFDQYHLAFQIETSGIGIRLKYKRLRSTEMRKACEDVLNPDNKYIDNVKALSSSFRKGGGATQAVIYLEQLIEETITHHNGAKVLVENTLVTEIKI